MTWGYSGDPTTDTLNEYRFYIGDTVESDPILSDEEINFILAKNVTHNYRMFRLFEMAATVLSRQIKRSLGPQSEDPTKRVEYYQAQYERYKKAAEGLISYPTLGTLSSDKYFTEGMHDNV